MHKTPADFPVLNLKTKHSHLVSIATDELTIIHPFSFFFGQDLDPFYFFYLILVLQGRRSEVIKIKIERQKQYRSYLGNWALALRSTCKGLIPTQALTVQQESMGSWGWSHLAHTSPIMKNILYTKDKGLPFSDGPKSLLELA